MMPIWLQLFFLTVGSVILPVTFLGAAQVWKQRIKIVEIEKDIVEMQKDIAALDLRYTETRKTIGRAFDGIEKLHRNVLLIGAELGLKNLERP